MAEACSEGAWAACISKLNSGEAPTQAETAAVCSSGLVEVLATLMYEQLEAQLQSVHMKSFWGRLVTCQQQPQSLQDALLPALQGLAAAVRHQSQQLSAFAQQLLLGVVQQAQKQQQQQQQQRSGPEAAAAAVFVGDNSIWQDAVPASTVALLAGLCQKHRTAVASILMATAPLSLPSVLQQYYRHQLLQLCDAIQQQQAAAGSSSNEGSDDAMSEGLGSPELHSPGSAAGSSPDRLPGAAHGARQGAGAAAASQLPDPSALLGHDWCAAVAATAACLEDLGLAAASEEAYTAVINSYVLQQLRTLATGELTSSVLPRAQQLVCAGPLAFLQVLLGPGHSTLVKLQEWQLRLTYLMLETLGGLRASDMFDIVIEYPHSAPALSDLALCLAHTNMAAQFAATFKSSLQQRLLHAGAATSDIIHTYVSTIRAMRQLGRSGLLLDIVSEPIRAYLRSRPDTIRCIVSMLTEDNNDSNSGSGSSLLQELQAQQQQGNAGAGIASSGSGAGFGFGPGGLTAAVAPPSAVAALSNAGSGKAGARVLLNWCVSEAEGDDAALRLLEALQAAPPDATATAAAGPGSGGPAAAGSGTPAGGENAKRPAAAAAASELEHAAGLLGLPQTRSAAAAAASSALLSGGHVAADVVSMLIGIYGGPLLFMEEYRLMLADRLLAKDEYDCQREIMTLELLKIRFGEAGLHPCEVMLKDLADSKRLDSNVRALPQQQQQQALPDDVAAALLRLRATICSYLFWPELPEHELKLPAELQTALDVYAERFRHLKAPRKLKWRHSLGLVELTLTIGGSEPLDFRVTPAHAALLLQFSDDSPAAAAAASAAVNASPAAAAAGGGGVVLSAGQLSVALGVPVPVVRRKAMFWVAAGVLLEQRGKGGEIAYSRATSIDPSRIVSREVTDASWADDTHAAASAEDRIIAEMGPFENYIIGLLTNCGSLPLDRLHNMLRVFVVGEPKYEGRSQEQLGAFLTVMAGQGKIEARNGVYSRPKPQQG